MALITSREKSLLITFSGRLPVACKARKEGRQAGRQAGGTEKSQNSYTRRAVVLLRFRAIANYFIVPVARDNRKEKTARGVSAR